MAQFLFRAQDNDMTNGDYAFFTFAPGRSSRTDQPWLFYTDASDDLPRRQQAFYAVKQVSPLLAVWLSWTASSRGASRPLPLLQAVLVLVLQKWFWLHRCSFINSVVKWLNIVFLHVLLVAPESLTMVSIPLLFLYVSCDADCFAGYCDNIQLWSLPWVWYSRSAPQCSFS